MPLKVPNGGKKENAEEVKAKVNASVKAESVVENVNTENLGSLSDKLSFVAALGDPSQDDVTYIPKQDGTKEKKVDPIIVGYRFVAEVDLEVPDVKPGDDLKKNLMSFTGDTMATRHVPAGTQFDLTKFETGMLISREEFNGRATGGKIPVSCSYANVTKKTSDGKLASTSAAAAVPSIALRAVGTGLSIKDAEIVPVLTFTKNVDPKTKVTRKERQIIKGFEKWEPLTKVQVATRTRSGSAEPTAKRNEMAAAFLQIAAAKKN